MKGETLFEKRERRARFRLAGKSRGRIRLSVFRSDRHMYAQIIDDVKGVTLAAASTLDKEIKASGKKPSGKEAAALVGTELAKRAIAKGVDKVVFDRGGFLYHGRIKALADGARAGGLSF